MIKEVTVTARKRPETLQNVSFSIAAMTESQMQDRGIVTIEDVTRNTVGFPVQNPGPGQSQVAIRGEAPLLQSHPVGMSEARPVAIMHRAHRALPQAPPLTS